MNKNHRAGFTLIELVVALAVTGILLGAGVPSFVEMVRASRTAAQYQSLVGALYLARSEAVKRARAVTICPRETDTRCSDDVADWSGGFLVFDDADASSGESAAAIGTGDTVLRVERFPDDGNTVRAYGIDRTASGTATSAAYVRYHPSGASAWRAGSLLVCEPAGRATYSRVVNVALTGDIRLGRKNAEGVPLDAFGVEIDCS